MTKQEFLKRWKGMSPVERDCWVAKAVMGWPEIRALDAFVVFKNRGHGGIIYKVPQKFPDGEGHIPRDWRPTTDWSAAADVLEVLRKKYTDVSLHAANGWGLTCWGILVGGEFCNRVGPFNAETGQEAICMTACAAFLIEKPSP